MSTLINRSVTQHYSVNTSSFSRHRKPFLYVTNFLSLWKALRLTFKTAQEVFWKTEIIPSVNRKPIRLCFFDGTKTIQYSVNEDRAIWPDGSWSLVIIMVISGNEFVTEEVTRKVWPLNTSSTWKQIKCLKCGKLKYCTIILSNFFWATTLEMNGLIALERNGLTRRKRNIFTKIYPLGLEIFSFSPVWTHFL